MCAVLNISPKTYYKYRNKEDSGYYDYLVIKEIFDDSKGTYGYRKITKDLKIKYGVVMNGKKILRIMKKYNLMVEYIRKSKKKNKNERIEDNVKPNLLNRNFITNEPNKVWDTDVIYLIFKGFGAYLSTIIDLYDRKVVDYKISKHNDNKFVMSDVDVAITDVVTISCKTIQTSHFPYPSSSEKSIGECTFEGAKSLTLIIDHDVGHLSNAYFYIYDSSAATTGINNNKKYGANGKIQETITINSNYVKIFFYSERGGNYFYGIKATVIPNY